MQKIIGVTELQRRFRSVFDQVAKQNTPYVLTRGSRPEAALISYEDYLAFQALQEQDVLSRFDRLIARMAEQNESVGEDEVAADVAAARADVAAARADVAAARADVAAARAEVAAAHAERED